MQNNANVKRSLNTISSSLKTVKSRKTVLIFVIIGLTCLYLASSYLLPAHKHFHQSQLGQSEYERKTCLDKYLVKWLKLMAVNDAVIKRIPASAKGNRFYPFTGNGRIGFGMDKDKMKFYLLTESFGNVESYIPAVEVKITENSNLEDKAIVLNVKKGMVSVVTTYDVEQSCVLVEETFYAHRKHSGLFYQEIKVINYGLVPIEVSFQSQPTKIFTKKISKLDLRQEALSKTTQSVSGEIDVKDILTTDKPKEWVLAFATVFDGYQATIKVPQKGEKINLIRSLTDFSVTEKPEKSKARRETTAVKSTEERVIKLRSSLSELIKSSIESDHLQAWENLWKVGVTVSSDPDPDSPSPLHVNLTEYYMYSTYNYNASDTKSLNCFTGPSTIHTAKHWVVPNDLKDLYTLRELWVAFFKENGCPSFSALTLTQLMVLSVVGFQFHEKQLQMGLNPLNLRTNISLRHISLDYFQSNDWFNLQVVVTNHRIEPFRIFITNTGKHVPKIYGCGSACEHVVEIGSSQLKFVIHPTDPVTPLFYISTNRTQLEQISKGTFMKKAIHSAKETKANSHHMRLSPKFWISVVILIVSFHVVVLKMIYNECRKSRPTGSRRSPFN